LDLKAPDEDWLLFGRTILRRTDPVNERREGAMVANVDRMVIIAAITNPPLRTGLIDRYMIAAAREGIQPIPCIKQHSTSRQIRLL
jgi:putative ribosome biogenesis GTPase RsgA